MKVLVITPEQSADQEIETCNLLLSNGLERLHVRKPNWSADELYSYLSNLNQEFLDRVSIHQHHELASKMSLLGVHFRGNDEISNLGKVKSKSCHSLKEVIEVDRKVDYCFISPVFDSISKTNYNSQFSIQELTDLKKKITQTELIGLGGINTSNIHMLLDSGIDGVAILGAIWQEKTPSDRLSKYLEIKHAAIV